MLLGTDELTILRGSKFYGTWQWVNSVTGDPEDFAGLSASIKIKNIHEDFEDIKNVFEVGTAIIEPEDIDGNATKGRVDVSLSKADTLNFTIPQSEDDKYGESGFYAILEILLSTGEVILQAKVRIVESLESETLDFLLDERDEAIIINGKLDNILLRNDEYISTRDNLIDVVIPTTVQTITDLAADIQINKDEITLTKEDVLLMKDNVQNNKDSVESMKLAIETIFDNFDDRFLGVFNEDPLLDNDGEVLKEGTIYYNSIDKELKFYNSVSWDNPTAAAQTYALQASQSASDALTSKDASKLSEDNAKLSEEVAIAKANAILNLTVEIETLAPNELATSNYDVTIGILTLKIPKGKKGEKGDSFIFEDFTPEQLSSLSASIIESNIPDLPITKITNLESTLNNKLNITDLQNVLVNFLLTPIITSPTSGTIDYIGAVTSSYTTSDTYAGIQDYVKWECGNVDFSIIYDSYEGNSNLTSWTPSTGLTLTQVFVRTKQGSDGHRSIYSDAINFTTPDIYIETPTLTVTGTPANVTLTPTLTISAFSVYNGTDTHLSTDWQVVKASDGTVVFESLNNTTNKTSITTSQLPMNTPLIFRARHNSTNYGSSAWVEVSGTTINIYIANPTLTVTGTPSSITLSPTLTGSAFTIVNGTDTHLSTDWQVIKVSDGTVAWESLANATNKTSIQATGLEKTIEYKFIVKYNSSTYGSSDRVEITGTTLDIYTLTPTLTVAGTPTNITKNPTLTTSSFAIYNGTDTHLSTDWQVIKNSDGTTVWESLNNTTNKLSITSGDLAVSIECRFRARHNSTNYGSSAWVEVIGTTKAVFTPTVGVQGAKGFGVAPTDEPFALLGLAEMTGTNTEGHDNYGNYIHTNGSIVCWCPKAYYRVGNAASPRYATYSVNALDIVGTDVYTTESAANAAGYVLPRAFINAGAEKSGFFIDKYMNSKDGTTSSKSVFGGVPISLTTSTTYTRSSDMTGCTGILADAVVLSKARGSRWNTVLAFQYAYLAMVSVAQGQAATSTANCAWYDATLTTNFPKGCNNNALSDVNDTTVTYLTAGDTGNANKPKTGATANFAKTTHNGSMNGVADLNGGMFEVSIGITNAGTTATATTAIATDTIYTLKTTIDHASLTGGWNTTNDVWGDATNLATKYNAVTSPHPLGSATGTVYWGNVANAVFPTDASGVNRDICGFIPKNSTASNATGINMLGNDYLYKYNINNMTPLCCGGWDYAANAGLFCRRFVSYRSGDYNYASFRASAYFA